jgi:putative Mg2+ transporter-C (MgtC) family protein
MGATAAVEIPSLYAQLTQLDPLPLIVSVIVGGIIGLEREMHSRPAGLRTHILVSLSCTILIVASRTLPPALVGQEDLVHLVMDPNRLGTGILTGIGFLGAASVIRAGDIVRGITTGASVWSTAGLGIVVGEGHYALALVGSGIMLVVLAWMDKLTRGIRRVLYRRLIVRGVRSEMPVLAERVATLLGRHGIRVQDLSGTRGPADEPFELVFHIRCRNEFQAPLMLEEVAAEKGVLSVEWSQISH